MTYVIFEQMAEAIKVATANGLKPTDIFLGVVKSECFIEMMHATGGVPTDGGCTYFCGLPVTLNSPTPGITIF